MNIEKTAPLKNIFQPIVERLDRECIIIYSIKNLLRTPVLFIQTLIAEL